MGTRAIYLVWFVFIHSVQLSTGQKIGISSALGLGCWNCAKRWNFGCESKKFNHAPCECANKNFIGTVLVCINDHAKKKKI